MLVATTSGGEIALHDLGGEGEVALLVHAASFTASMFAPFAAHLSPNYHCLAPDLPGHGRSPRPKGGDYSWSHLADELCSVIDAIDAPILGFGHSLGGTLMAVAAARRPERVRALVVYEPVLIEGAQGHRLAEEQALRSEHRYERFDSEQQLRDRLLSKPPLDHLDDAALAAYVRDGFEHDADGSVRLVLSPEDEARIYRESTRVDFAEELRGLAAPVSILIGGSSPGAASLGATRLAALLSDAGVTSLEQASHLAPLEQPGAVAARVKRAFDTPAA